MVEKKRRSFWSSSRQESPSEPLGIITSLGMARDFDSAIASTPPCEDISEQSPETSERESRSNADHGAKIIVNASGDRSLRWEFESDSDRTGIWQDSASASSASLIPSD